MTSAVTKTSSSAKQEHASNPSPTPKPTARHISNSHITPAGCHPSPRPTSRVRPSNAKSAEMKPSVNQSKQPPKITSNENHTGKKLRYRYTIMMRPTWTSPPMTYSTLSKKPTRRHLCRKWWWKEKIRSMEQGLEHLQATLKIANQVSKEPKVKRLKSSQNFRSLMKRKKTPVRRV